MTYPPQQPGPYGPQDPHGGQNPYGQQNPYGRQNPYGQQPQWGAPQWGQQPGYGYPPGPPPKKSRTGLVTTLVIVAVLLVGGGAVAAFLLLKDNAGGGGDPGGSPRAAADAFAEKLGAAVSSKPEDASLDAVKPLMCASDYKELNDELQDAKKDDDAGEQPEKTTFAVTNFKEEGEGATFDMTQKRGDDERDPLAMEVTKENGDWVVCGLYDGQQDQQEDSPAASASSGDDDPPADQSIPNPIPKSSR